jgi:hypothetical protein
MYDSTTILKTFMNEKQVGSATGFFYAHNGRLFLVTCKHVIYGDNFGQYELSPVPTPKINRVEIRLHTNPKNASENENIAINLFYEDAPLWLEHYYSDVDIVLIPITFNPKKYIIKSINFAMLDYGNIVVDYFVKIFILGYPYGWYDQYNNLPIARSGNLASPFPFRFQGKPMLLGDVITHEGMSGGPVFMRLENFVTKEQNDTLELQLGKMRTFLIGVYSGQYSQVQCMNLVTIWKAEMIPEILALNML